MLRLIRNRIVEMILDVVEQSHNILFYSIYKLLYISYLSILFKIDNINLQISELFSLQSLCDALD